MRHAIEIVDLDQMKSLVNDLREYNSELAEALHAKMDQFEYEAILALLS